MVAEKDLDTRLTQLKTSISDSEWFYFHLESIDNFIFHLPNIENERTRFRGAEKIRQYLEVIEQRSKFPFDPIETYKDLNRTYIWPISHFYTDELGFIQKPDYPLYIIFAFIIGFVMQLILPVWLAISIVVVLFTLKIVSNSIKMRKRKFY